MTLRRCCKQCNKPILDRQKDGVARIEELPVAKSGDHWHVPSSSERRAKTLESRPSADLCISLTRTEVTSADATEQEPAQLLRSTAVAKIIMVVGQNLSEARL